MIYQKIFKERLSALIGSGGRKSFGNKTGVSESNISKYLRGDCLPPLNVLEKIASANNVTIGWLIGEATDSEKKAAAHPTFQNSSMQELADWISEQNDGINYWEIAKVKMTQEFPEFKSWLARVHRENHE